MEEPRPWWQLKRWQAAAGVAALAAIGLLALVAVIVVVTLPGVFIREADPGTATGAARLKAESDVRGSLVSLTTGLVTAFVAAIAGTVALLNFRETRRQNLASLETTRRGQVTDRFSKAIDQLGETKQLDIRTGAIYALEQIARDSNDLHWPVMQVLTAYLRENSARLSKSVAEEQRNRPWPRWRARARALVVSTGGSATAPQGVDPELPAPSERARDDFLAVANVLRQRRWRAMDPVDFVDQDGHTWREGLNLQGSDLREAKLQGGYFERAIFDSGRLQAANFKSAHLRKASFWYTKLDGARFDGADLQGARFWNGSLRGAHFEEAELRGTAIEDLALQSAHFNRAQLQSAYFRKVQVDGASFFEAQLQGARFEEVDLSKTEGLSQEQLDSVICDEKTTPPHGLQIKPTTPQAGDG
jgi:hypothetical protein